MTEDLQAKEITGYAADDDETDILKYCWLEGTNIIDDWRIVEQSGECPLYLVDVELNIGTPTLTLKVTDGKETASDEMILTIENSAPYAASNGGTYEIGYPISISAELCDYDGDMLIYKWIYSKPVIQLLI
ncbi:MAG: hypothetical protein JW913_07880 [Chitinispirillaceae bacterium]|nr:hypothetical protein [Chitinispirillaceae bacterium]